MVAEDLLSVLAASPCETEFTLKREYVSVGDEGLSWHCLVSNSETHRFSEARGRGPQEAIELALEEMSR